MFEPVITIEPMFMFDGRKVPLKQTIIPVLFMVQMGIAIESEYSNIPVNFQAQMDMAQIINLN